MPALRPPVFASETITLDILVEAGDWPPESELKTIASQVLEAAIETMHPVLANNAELSMVFTDDVHIRELNRQFRNTDKATNVLSFPAAPLTPDQFGPLLGDVILSRDTILREAKADGLTIEAHLAHLILHGFLHTLGYDHVDDSEALTMERLETAILENIGVADPYSGDQ